MINTRITKWSKVQYMLLVTFLIYIKFNLFSPYAIIRSEDTGEIVKSMMGYGNLTHYFSLAIISVNVLTCYSDNERQDSTWKFIIFSTIANLYFNLMSVMRDGRTLTYSSSITYLVLPVLIYFQHLYFHKHYRIRRRSVK